MKIVVTPKNQLAEGDLVDIQNKLTGKVSYRAEIVSLYRDESGNVINGNIRAEGDDFTHNNGLGSAIKV